MAVSPEDSDDLAEGVADAYAEAEVGLLGRIASFIGLGLDLDSWSADRRNGAGLVRRTVSTLLTGFFRRGRRAVDKAAQEAERRGVAQADAELGAHSDDLPPPSGAHAKRGAERIGDDLTKVEQAMFDQGMKAYHRIVTEVSQAVENGTATRLQAASKALAKFADAGITGFVDKRGRNWEIRTYVEMAVRTHTANVMVDAHVGRLEEAGVRLVMVSQAPYECDKCKPWEGKILEVGGPAGKHTVKVRSGRAGQSVSVEVAGSLEEARSAGLFHPNCRHSVEGYLPGSTRAPEKPDTKGVTYKDTQKQRYLERQARKWDRRRAVAVDDEQRKAADVKFKQYRKQIREHTARTGLRRKTNREKHDQTR